MKPVHVVGYGMSDALGINPTECYQKMLDPNDYSREIPGMKKQCEEIFHLIIHRGAMHDEDRIIMPDGNGDFAKSVNMINDFTNRGFGMRSWRYCMYVKNAEIKVRYAEWGEPEACPIQDPFEVSSAEQMIEALKHIKAN